MIFKKYRYLLSVAALLLSGCLEGLPGPSNPDPKPDPAPEAKEIWELRAAGCSARLGDTLTNVLPIRLTIGETSATARVVSTTFPQVVCYTQETVTYPSANTMRFVDGTTACQSTSAHEQYPWGSGPEDVTFDSQRFAMVLILSKTGDARCGAGQSYNYVFELLGS